MRLNLKRNLWILLILTIALLIRGAFEIAIEFFRVDYSFTDFIVLILRYFITFIAFLIWIRIIIKSEYSSTKLLWLIFLAIDPFTGLAFFLTFGRDFKESLRYRNHPLLKDGKYLTLEPVTDFGLYEYQSIDSEITDIYKTAYNMTQHHAYLDDTSIQVLTNGDEFFPALLEKINNAKKFIFMQFYIIRTDKTGKLIFDALKKKVDEGVEVKVLYDSIGSFFLNQKYKKKIKKSGIELEAIDPVYFGLFNTRVNYRNHRKVCVIDGEFGFTGGMNLANEYWNKRKRFPKFRDTQLLLKGMAVNSLTALFLRDWYYTTDKFISNPSYYCAEKINAEGIVQVIPSGPDFKYPPIRNIYVKMINNAKKSIKIMTPYLALDHEMITSLIIAARGGVNVEIIVPGKPDKKSVYLVTQSFFEELLEEGIKIYKYNNAFTHAKVFMIDDMLASCGTYNLDNRSARINFEVTTLLYKQGVEELVDDFNNDRSKSTIVSLEKWKKRGLVYRIFEGIIALFSPIV